MGRKVGEISGMPMTDPHKREGNRVKDYALTAPTQQIRQVDGGMWQGPSLRNKTEGVFVKYIKEQRTMNPNDKMMATRKDFVEALMNAYYVGKGMR